MKGLLMMLKKPKGLAKAGPLAPESDDEETAPDSETGGSEKEFARLAYQAIKAGDEDAFIDALVEAIRACSSKEEADEYPPAA